jgi:hypothetical protein
VLPVGKKMLSAPYEESKYMVDTVVLYARETIYMSTCFEIISGQNRRSSIASYR